jgi:hypothetical protein
VARVPDPDPEAARRIWASTAEEHLAAVTQAVQRLLQAFQTERERPRETDEAVASQVVAACSSLIGWLRSSHAPRGFAKAGGELGAAAGVYRNAAVAFKSLVDVDGDQREARSNACATLLEQGDHHVDVFLAALAKKLGDTRSRAGRNTIIEGGSEQLGSVPD